MSDIYVVKEQETPDTPVLLFECTFADGQVERWATNPVSFSGQSYAARVLSHRAFDLRAGSEDGIDGISQIQLQLANADSHFSQLERSVGFKGAQIVARLAFFDLSTGLATTPATVVFRGVANSPEESGEAALRVTFLSQLNLQRVLLPNVRIQRRCPWVFPRNAAERAEAVFGGVEGKYSIFARCGYSPDQAGGVGSLNAGSPFTSCDFTRASCQQRGMFDRDSSNRTTRRFGGVEFVPASAIVRGHGEARRVSTPVENAARYNDFVPMIYGTAWYQPPIVFAQNDGNLTRLEVLLGIGEMDRVISVVVNGIAIPAGVSGTDMTATGWYNVVSLGNKTGGFNLNFTSVSGQPLGDPYGSMAYLAIAVPNRVSDGRVLPKVEVLVNGLKVSTFDASGSYVGEAFSNNPAWVMLDVLRRVGWSVNDFDLASFASAAAYCNETVTATDLFGNPASIARYQTNLVLRQRQSAAETVRGLRNSAGLQLTFSSDGKLRLFAERTLGGQQASKPAGSNSTATISGGWPAYEFGDGTYNFGGILRRATGEPSIRLYSRSNAETANRVSLEFQDSFNEYQQDSVSLADTDDVLLAGQEVALTLNAPGVANVHQALRVAKLHLDRAIRGNLFAEFETSMKGLAIRPGDLITITYLKEGLDRELFRVVQISPSVNFRTARIAAQLHRDAWYTGVPSANGGRRRRGAAECGIPRPLAGSITDSNGLPQFAITETLTQRSDGSTSVTLQASYVRPAGGGTSRAAIPIIGFYPTALASGGTLAGNRTLYYAITATDSDGVESDLSFAVPALLGSGTFGVRLESLAFDSDMVSFSVYRGPNPQQLERIANGLGRASQYVDTGLAGQRVPPPDPCFDHANFWWRFEQLPEINATVATALSIGNSTLSLLTNEWRNSVVRIMRGRGAGQERRILANDATTLAIDRPWSVTPDTSSVFTIAEADWRFGTLTRSDEARIEVPNRGGATVQVSGRSANARDEESPAELSPLTRWQIGGSAGSALDTGVPPLPSFGLAAPGDGNLELLSVGFTTLVNTRSVTAGSLILHYWNELASPSAYSLSAALTAGATTLSLTPAAPATVGDLIQVDEEVMSVTAVLGGGAQYQVSRGAKSTTAASHTAGAKVYHLATRSFVASFPRDFFGSPASGSYASSFYIPDVRVAAAELSVTNLRGESPRKVVSLTGTVDDGLRTFSGTQITIQVDGYLSIQSSAAPPVSVRDASSVRDVFAVVREAPTGGPVSLQVKTDGAVYCTLTIPAGALVSNTVNGFGLAPLAEKAKITVDILSVPSSGTGTPGRDLAVTIRQ